MCSASDFALYLIVTVLLHSLICNSQRLNWRKREAGSVTNFSERLSLIKECRARVIGSITRQERRLIEKGFGHDRRAIHTNFSVPNEDAVETDGEHNRPAAFACRNSLVAELVPHYLLEGLNA